MSGVMAIIAAAGGGQGGQPGLDGAHAEGVGVLEVQAQQVHECVDRAGDEDGQAGPDPDAVAQQSKNRPVVWSTRSSPATASTRYRPGAPERRPRRWSPGDPGPASPPDSPYRSDGTRFQLGEQRNPTGMRQKVRRVNGLWSMNNERTTMIFVSSCPGPPDRTSSCSDNQDRIPLSPR